MTREAKIGLLVALAFLLVIGILLSDHVTTSLRTPAAALGDIQKSIEGSTTWPGANAAPQTQPRLPEQQPAEQPTIPFIYSEPEPQIEVARGVPDNALQHPPIMDEVASNQAPANPAGDIWSNPPITGQVQGQIDNPVGMLSRVNPIIDEAGRNGVEMEAVNPAGQTTPAGPNPQGTSGLNGVKEYTIQPGDSLSKITAKFLGRDNPANRAVIYSLNPKLKANPDRIIVGETCQVPASPDAAKNLAAASQPPRQPAADAGKPQQRPAQPAARTPAAGKTYTVKKGDTLWKIAETQLGSGGRHKEILKLNSDKLDSADDLQPGMKLKLPA